MVVRRSLAVAIALVFAMLVVGCCPTGPSIRVTPSEVAVVASGTVEFTASVKCLDNTGVTWTATCGSMSGTGSRVTYTAPGEPGSCTVTATSVVRSDMSASALVTVVDPDDGPPDVPPGATGTVEGTVFMPDGGTPVSNAFVGVPHEAEGAGITARQTTYNVNEDDWLTYTFSAADGSFSLLNVPTGLTTLRIIKGQWSLTLHVNVAQSATSTLTPEETTLPSSRDEGAPNIAVIPGVFDRMEDVLAKIGLGDVDADGRLVPGTEQFDVYHYPLLVNDLLTDAELLSSYDIVFFNCGAPTIYATRPEVQQNLQDFVSRGGVLYFTDLTYSFVEEVFPGRIEFLGPIGAHGFSSEAEVLTEDSIGLSFKNWLANENVLNPDGTVTIGGFAIGWAVIDNVDDSVRVWIRGEVYYNWFTEVSVRPLTVSFSHGAGRVLFTSYHTVGHIQPELFPQEVVLAGLVFEM